MRLLLRQDLTPRNAKMMVRFRSGVSRDKHPGVSGGSKASHKREERAEAWPFSERLGIAQGSTNRSRRKLLQSVTKLSETEVNVTLEAKHANPGSKMAK